MDLPAEAAHEQQWTVTVDPLTAALGFAHVQVERALHDRVSVYVGPSLKLYDGILPNLDGRYRGYGAEAGVRGFFTGDAPRGGWVMVRGVLASVSGTPVGGGPERSVGGYTSGLVGYTGILGPGLVLSGGAGLSYFDYGTSEANPEWGIHGLLPALHTNVGWAF